jgi:hypothetical protein
MPRNLLAAFAVSALLALMLSLVPSVKWNPAKQDVATFQMAEPVAVSEQNLVDLFTLVPTHYNIKRVKWENESIFVDFLVTPRDGVELPLIYRDFYSLTYDMFLRTRNVKRVFFRLLEAEQDSIRSSKLLVAIEAERPRNTAVLFPPETIKDIKMYVEETFPVRLDPYFHERVSPSG